MQRALVVKVVVDVRSRSVDKLYEYWVPEEWAAQAKPGCRVFVSFGKQHCGAFIVEVNGLEEIGSHMKPILRILDEEPLLTPDLLALSNWLVYRYACTRLQAIHSLLPAAFRDEKSPVKAKTEVYLVASASPEDLRSARDARKRRAKKQAELLDLLLAQGEFVLGSVQLQPSNPSVRALVEENLAYCETREIYRTIEFAEMGETGDDKALTSWQQRALSEILLSLRKRGEQAIVVHGVTGSGKTEVYLQAISECQRQGGGAIILVPEISLTPQMVGRFISRFGNQVAVLHSGLSDGERRDEWLRIRRNEANIVVGARSAVFAPVENLRLIIIDEEHEPSYKQEESPRYDAREAANRRAELTGATVVLGSATPSLYMMHQVETGRAKLVSMPFRVNGKPLPPVQIVDMRDELRAGNRSLFSRELQIALEETIEAHEQAILFLNRRGYAAFVLCRHCGEGIQCPRCDISLTVHKSGHKTWLRCHYCQYEVAMPELCPTCGENGIRPFGIGTQQVEQAIRDRWPNWRTLRMDVDTTRRKGAHQALIQSFWQHEADILIGTQMIAKGLDFPDVSLVGVIAADTMLSVPDYRSGERTFQLLTQVAGRAGRAEVAGRTVVQTYRPEHFAICAAAHHDFHGFYEEERQIRKAFHYPPFCELCVFLATHEEEKLARGAAMRFERELRRRLPEHAVVVLPASPSGVARIEDKYRYQVVVKYLQWDDVRDGVVSAFELVYEKMVKYRGTCSLDVFAGRIG